MSVKLTLEIVLDDEADLPTVHNVIANVANQYMPRGGLNGFGPVRRPDETQIGEWTLRTETL